MSETLNCAVIGCGAVAPTHVESYQKLEGVNVNWACDLVEDKARGMAEKYNIPNFTTDYRELLNNPEVKAVSVCTEHFTHDEICKNALQAGKHVLCEKPLAISREKMNDVLATHEKMHKQIPNLVFSSVFQHRFDSAYRYLKSLIEEGALGTIVTAGVQIRLNRNDNYYEKRPWCGKWNTEGGSVLINQAIHNIDSLAWVMDGVEAVSGSIANMTHQHLIETEDTCVANLRFRCGALGIIEVTSCSHMRWETTLSVHGTLGSIDLRNAEPLKILFLDEEKQKEVTTGFASCVDKKAIVAGKDYYGPSHPAMIADFCDAVKNGRAPFVPASAARHAADIVIGIYQSHNEKRWVDIDSRP